MPSRKLQNRRKFLKVTALGAASAAILAACAPSAPTSTPSAVAGGAAPDTKPTEAAKAAAGSAKIPTFPLVLGFIGPLTGDVKTYGESTKNAFDLAVAEANEAGAKITTKIVDDKNDATEAANAATKLINQDKVKTIVGSITSKCTIPVSEIANSNKVVLVTPTATAAKVTVDGKRKDYVFRTCFIDPFQGSMMAKFATETLKVKKAAVLFDMSNDYSKGLAEVFKADFTKAGGEVAEFLSYATADVDFSATLTKVAAASVDFLYLPDYYNKVSLIAKQAREKGIKATFGGPDGWDSADLDTKATEGGYFTNHYSADDPRPIVQEWVSKYKAKFGSVPDALGTLAYDATRVVIAAAAMAGSDDPTKIRSALADFPGLETVTGNIKFDKNGDPIKSAAILQIKDGKQKFVATVNP